MICPKCGAQADENEVVCPCCKEELTTAGQEIKPAEQELEATAEPEQSAEQAAETHEEAKKDHNLMLLVQAHRTAVTCIAAVAAVVIFIVAIFGIVSMAKKIVGPEYIAEEYVEAMADGNIKKALRKTAPWVLRSIAETLDIDPNSSAARIANEYEEQMGVFGLGSPLTIEDTRLRGYTDTAMGEALDELNVFDTYSISYKELKAITEIAVVEVKASLTVLGEKEQATFKVYCARLDGEWTVILLESNY